MVKRRANTTRLEIIQTATRMFLEHGFSATSVKAIADELGISTGHLTFYFPTKEHLLEELVDMLCNFQWAQVRQHIAEGDSLLMALCLELISMAAICEKDEIAKDFYLAAYTHPMTLETIRRNDAQRAKLVLGEYCPDWTDEQFAEAETLVSGIEYATLMITGDSAPLPLRISGALRSIMQIYQIPQTIREEQIAKALDVDYRRVGQWVLDGGLLDITSRDEYGNILKIAAFDAEGNVLNCTEYKYTYDEKGNVLRSECSVDGVLDTIEEYLDDVLVREITAYAEVINEEFSMRYPEKVIEYNEDGTRLEIFNGVYGEPETETTCAADGKVISQRRYVYETFENDSWKRISVYENDTLVCDTQYVIDEGNEFSRKDTMTQYHEDKTTTVTTYDESENVVSEIKYDAEGKPI